MAVQVHNSRDPKINTCQIEIISVNHFFCLFQNTWITCGVNLYTKWQSWWSIQPIIRTVIIISSPLFMPWNITARKAKRWPKGGSNTGGNEHIDCICGFMHPFDLMSVAEFKISPFWPTRCNVTSDTRLWFQPMMKFAHFLDQLQYFKQIGSLYNTSKTYVKLSIFGQTSFIQYLLEYCSNIYSSEAFYQIFGVNCWMVFIQISLIFIDNFF